MVTPIAPGTNTDRANQLLEELYMLKYAIPVIHIAFKEAMRKIEITRLPTISITDTHSVLLQSRIRRCEWLHEGLGNCLKGMIKKTTEYLGKEHGDLLSLALTLKPIAEERNPYFA